MKRYRQIELDSGIKFFEEIGYLRIGLADDKNAHDVSELAQSLREDGVEINYVDDLYAEENFPYLR